MAIEELTIFRTSDGREFETRSDAEKYEAHRESAKNLSNELGLLVCIDRDTDTDALAEWILDHFDRKNYLT